MYHSSASETKGENQHLKGGVTCIICKDVGFFVLTTVSIDTYKHYTITNINVHRKRCIRLLA